MADGFSIEMSDADMTAIFHNLDVKTEAMFKRAGKAFDTAIQNTLDTAQANCPVGTWDEKAKENAGRVHLRDTGYADFNGAPFGGYVSFGQGLDPNHGWFVELGTSKMAPRPFLIPAFTDEVAKLQFKLVNILGQGIA